MRFLRGIAVSPGIAIGPVVVLDRRTPGVAHRRVAEGEVAAEAARLTRALDSAAREAEEAIAEAAARVGPQYADILGAHARMIADPALRREALAAVRERRLDAGAAVSSVLGARAAALREAADRAPYLADRARDIEDVERRVLRQLLREVGEDGSGRSEPGARDGSATPDATATVLLAHDLTPGETADLDPRRVLGFATEGGGATSHTAIVANALGIPAVVGLGPFLEGTGVPRLVVLDGTDGLLVLNPDAETLRRYERLSRRRAARAVDLQRSAALPARTADDVALAVMGNIEFPEEVEACLRDGADGVGLYRSEFLYLGTSEPVPTEDRQAEVYARVGRAMGGRPVTIRTLDLGADKIATRFSDPADERNPFLGLRSLRLSLRELPLFRTQLRAIARAAADSGGDLRVMFPLVTSVPEFRAARGVLEDVLRELATEGVAAPSPGALKVGAMVEVPAAAIMADKLAAEADFLSVGTNDLVQYTLAVDRDNAAVADLYQSADPAVLRLLDLVVRAGRASGIEVTVCGAMAGELRYVPLLVGLGVRSLSMTPARVPAVKRLLRGLTVAEAEGLAARALESDSAREVEAMLDETLARLRWNGDDDRAEEEGGDSVKPGSGSGSEIGHSARGNGGAT